MPFTLAPSDNPNDPTNSLLLQQGYPPDQTRIEPGVYPPFRDADTWMAILASSAKFDWVVAVENLPKVKVDDAKKPKDDDKKPPPGMTGRRAGGRTAPGAGPAGRST